MRLLSCRSRVVLWIVAAIGAIGLFGPAVAVAAPPADPSAWIKVSGAMQTASFVPRAVAVLPDGRALLIGGQNLDNHDVPSVDIYNPVTRSWTAATDMNVGRVYPAVAVLHDGRVLVAGGISDVDFEASAELYDPSSNTWSLLPAMPGSVAAARAVTLNDGRVLVVGGFGADNLDGKGTLLFSPDGTWTSGPSLTTGRQFPDVTLLADGSVLVSGGSDPNTNAAVASAERIDPTASAVTPAGQMSVPRVSAVTVRLADGRVLSAGGSDAFDAFNDSFSSADIYDPVSNTWSAAASMNVSRYKAVGGVLPDGRVLVAGGLNIDADTNTFESSAELYDPTSNVWTTTTSMSEGRYAASGAIVPGGLLVAGGTPDASTYLTDAEVYIPDATPVAKASAPATAAGVSGSNTALVVSAAGSSDPAGLPLTYTWTDDATNTTLAVTADPIQSAIVGLGVGPHVLTLTVSDSAGGTATATVSVTITDATADLQAQNAMLQSQVGQLTKALQQAQGQLDTCTASGTAVQTQLTAIGASLGKVFDHPLFVIPGTTPAAQLQSLAVAISNLNHGQQQALFKNLGGE